MKLHFAIHPTAEYPWKMTTKIFYIRDEEKPLNIEAIGKELGFKNDRTGLRNVSIYPVDNVSEDTPQIPGIPVIP